MLQSLSPGECVKKFGGSFIQWMKSNKRKWTPNSFNEMNETTKSNHMWKGTDTKDCIWFDFIYLVFPCGSAGKESTCNAGDLGLIPVLGRSPVEGKGYPCQYSGLENSPWGHKGSDTTERLSHTSHLKTDQWLPWDKVKIVY